MFAVSLYDIYGLSHSISIGIFLLNYFFYICKGYYPTEAEWRIHCICVSKLGYDNVRRQAIISTKFTGKDVYCSWPTVHMFSTTQW